MFLHSDLSLAKSSLRLNFFISFLATSIGVLLGLPLFLGRSSTGIERTLLTEAVVGLRFMCPNHLKRPSFSFSPIGASPWDEMDDLKGNRTRMEKLSLKKKGLGSEARAERMAKGDTDLQLMGQAEQERHIKKQNKRRNQGRAEDV